MFSTYLAILIALGVVGTGAVLLASEKNFMVRLTGNIGCFLCVLILCWNFPLTMLFCSAMWDDDED